MNKLINLGSIFKITSGGTPSRKIDEYYSNGTIPWIKTGDLKSKYINESSEHITELAVAKSSAKLFPQKTVLIAMYGATIGATSILNIEATTNQACAAFLPTEKVIPEYLYYFFTVNKQKIISMGVGGAQPNISGAILKKISFPLTEINNQKRIVNILDKAQELINKRKEQIEALDELVKSKFIEMFGEPFSNAKDWEKKSLNRVVTNDCTISYGIVQPGEDQEDGISVFRPVDIVSNKKPKLEELKKTTAEISNRYKKTLLQGNEILMTVRANIGDVCIIGEEFKGCNVGRGIVPIRVKDEINPIFLKHQFESHRIQQELKALAKGITLIQLNMEDLREFMIIVPPIELQNQFADFVKQVDEIKLKMENSLKELEDNFNSLMQRAFKGELFK